MTDFPPPSLALDATTLLSHSAWLAKFARALVANEADIDDVVQQTLATALARPPRHTGNLRGWRGTVAKNVVRSSARSDTVEETRGTAHEGVAARALLLSRLRDIAASAGRPFSAGVDGAHGSSAVSRGFGRTADEAPRAGNRKRGDPRARFRPARRGVRPCAMN